MSSFNNMNSPNHYNININGGTVSNSPSHSPLRQQETDRSGRSREGGTCYNCQKQGHWAVECPNKTPKKSNNSSSSPESVFLGMDGLLYSPPSYLCRRCGVRCTTKTSTTPKNPNRDFYSCPNENCNSMKWKSDVTSDDLMNVPKCTCGAGFCRLWINAGHKYFVCNIRKGQGACSFSKQLDGELTNGHVDIRISSPQSTMIDYNDNSLANSEGEGNFSHEGMEIGSRAMDTAQCSQNPGEMSCQLKRVQLMEMEFEEQEDTSNEPLRKPNKRLRLGTPQYDVYSLNSAIESIDMLHTNSRDPSVEEELQASVLRSEMEIHLRQVEFWRQISIKGITLAVSSTSSFPSNLLPLKEDWLVSLFKGWWGRLAYPPSQCLILPAPKPFFCCVFPSFDPIFAPEGPKLVDTFDGETSAVPPGSPLATGNHRLSILSHGQNHQLSSDVHLESSRVRSLSVTVQDSFMTGAISEGFANLAMDLQNKLLTLLESTDFHNHNYMVREVRIAFAAFDQLQVGCQPFRERVEEFIKCASYLSDIEDSIRNDESSHELLEQQCNCKKKRLDDIYRDYDMVKANLEASRERFQFLSAKASRVRDMLFQVEAELTCCKAENQHLEDSFDQISKDLIESKQSFQVAFVTAEESLKLLQQRKEDRNVANVAFKKARVRLPL